MQSVILWNVNANFSSGPLTFPSLTRIWWATGLSSLPYKSMLCNFSHPEHRVFLSAKFGGHTTWFCVLFGALSRVIPMTPERTKQAQKLLGHQNIKKNIAQEWKRKVSMQWEAGLLFPMSHISKATKDARPLECGQKSCNSTDGWWEMTRALLCPWCTIENDILVSHEDKWTCYVWKRSSLQAWGQMLHVN